MMRPMRDQITPALVFQGLPMAFNAGEAKNIKANYRFDITGDGGGTWTVKIADGTCEIVEGGTDYDWRFELSTDTWIGMTTGDFMGQEAFMLGHVTVEGNPVDRDVLRPPLHATCCVKIDWGKGSVTAKWDSSADDARALLLLTHGAGGDMNDNVLRGVGAELAGHGIAVMRFNLAYREAGRKAPGSATESEACWRGVADAARRDGSRCSSAASRTADVWRRISSRPDISSTG